MCCECAVTWRHKICWFGAYDHISWMPLFYYVFFRVNANVHPLTIYNRILLRPRVVCIVWCCDDSGFLINEKQKRSKETRVWLPHLCIFCTVHLQFPIPLNRLIRTMNWDSNFSHPSHLFGFSYKYHLTPGSDPDKLSSKCSVITGHRLSATDQHLIQ